MDIRLLFTGFLLLISTFVFGQGNLRLELPSRVANNGTLAVKASYTNYTGKTITLEDPHMFQYSNWRITFLKDSIYYNYRCNDNYNYSHTFGYFYQNPKIKIKQEQSQTFTIFLDMKNIKSITNNEKLIPGEYEVYVITETINSKQKGLIVSDTYKIRIE